jgi:hypothetical protein
MFLYQKPLRDSNVIEPETAAKARPECTSKGSAFALKLPGFPVSVVVCIFNLGGRPLTQLMLLAGLLNSFVAMAIIWLVLSGHLLSALKEKCPTARICNICFRLRRGH